MSLNMIAQLFVDGAWVTYPGYSEDGWELSIGPDVESGLRANSLTFTLNNDDLSMDPTNVKSALYGKIGRNTRTRMRLNGLTLTTAEASSWQPDATSEHQPATGRGRAHVDLQAEGLLRRLGRWTDPIRSAMARQILSYTTLTGYWTLEDQSSSVQLSNEVSGAQPGSYSGTVTLQGDDGAGGADGAVKIGSDGQMRGTFLTPAGNGYQLTWATKLATAPSSASFNTIMTWTDTARRTWVWQVNNINHQVSVSDSNGTFIDSIAFGYGSSYAPTQWVRYRVKVTVSGSTLTYEPAVYAQDSVTPAGVTRTFSSATAGRVSSWQVAGNSYTDGAAYDHVMAVTDTAIDLIANGDPKNSFNGYLGELSWQRFTRLMYEEGLSPYVSGVYTNCVKMGRQKPAVFLDLIQEVAQSEGGLIYDEPSDIALTLVTYRGLINRAVSLNLTKSQLITPLRKVIDDIGVINDVTVRNWDGSTANSELFTGALSTLVPPSGIGRVKATVDVSTIDSLPNRANWEMRKGTLDRPRYLSVSIDLFANPSLADTVTAMRPGAWIAISGLEPDLVRLRVISINRKGDTVRDTVTFNCLPAEVYQIAVYDDSSYRYDSASTTLDGPITTTTQTFIGLTTAVYQDRWSSATPYNIKIAGERMTVTAMTAAAGSGPWTQTATVTRAVNGVAKTHLAGTAVNLFSPSRYALT